MSFSEPLVWSGISGRSSTISNSALLVCSRANRRSSVAKPVRRRKIRSNLARNATDRRLAGFEPVSLEAGVEVPDQTADPFLRGTMAIVERVQLMHQPFRVNPAQRVPADLELAGVVTQHHGFAQEFVRLNTAP